MMDLISRIAGKEKAKENAMSDKQKKIIDTFKKIVPDLSDVEQEKILAFGQGVETVINSRKENENGKVHSNNH